MNLCKRPEYMSNKTADLEGEGGVGGPCDSGVSPSPLSFEF